MYETNFVRSAMAPETIVAAVAANTSWKKNFEYKRDVRPADRREIRLFGRRAVVGGDLDGRFLQEETAVTHELVADAEHQPKADDPVRHAAVAEVEQVLHTDVGRVLGPREPGFHQAEPGLHPHHEKRRDHDPDGVQRDAQRGDIRVEAHRRFGRGFLFDGFLDGFFHRRFGGRLVRRFGVLRSNTSGHADRQPDDQQQGPHTGAQKGTHQTDLHT